MVSIRRSLTGAAVAAAALMLAACSGGSAGKKAEVAPPSDPAKVSGNITVLTNRTDLVQDGTMKKYAAEFATVYPKVSVKFQAITDYDGDVLLIPNAIQRKDYPNFFASLGPPADLAKKYRYTSYGTVNGKVYGI